MYNQLRYEAELLKGLKHPGIPIIYDLEEDNQYLYIIEEYIKGKSLQEQMLNQALTFPQNKTKVINYMMQLCDIMEYLHNIKPFPILYLDLKPAHIIVCDDVVKIIDFGAAIFMEKEKADYSFGTPSFAAPEQYDSLRLNPKTDIYALGSIMYFMLLGKNPAPRINEKELREEIKKLPDNFQSIILKCMAKEPDKRFTSVNELKKQIIKCECEKNSLKKYINKGIFKVIKSKEPNKTDPAVIIGITGSEKGVGVTHTSIMLGNYITARLDAKTAVVELSGDYALKNLYNEIHNKKHSCDERKCFTISGLDYYYEADSQTLCTAAHMDYKYVIADIGSDYELYKNTFLMCDKKIIIGNLNLWQRKNYIDFIERLAINDKFYEWNFLSLNAVKEDIAYIKEVYDISLKLCIKEPDPFVIHEGSFGFLERLLC